MLGCYTVTFNGNLAQEREVILSQKGKEEEEEEEEDRIGVWIKLCLKFPSSLKKILWSNQFI